MIKSSFSFRLIKLLEKFKNDLFKEPIKINFNFKKTLYLKISNQKNVF